MTRVEVLDRRSGAHLVGYSANMSLFHPPLLPKWDRQKSTQFMLCIMDDTSEASQHCFVTPSFICSVKHIHSVSLNLLIISGNAYVSRGMSLMMDQHPLGNGTASMQLPLSLCQRQSWSAKNQMNSATEPKWGQQPTAASAVHQS
jgi:hypothetical protein